MNLQDILAAMKKWDDSRNQQGISDMKTWLGQGNSFSFQAVQNNPIINGQDKAYLHAYPGIVGNSLNFFVIPSSKDVSSTQNIKNYIEICPAVTLTPGSATSPGNIPVQDAYDRINYWNQKSDDWIAANCGTTNSIYSCMCLPQGDTLLGTQHDAFFALKTSPSAPGGFTADVIIEDTDAQQIVYFDLAEPVPPFSASGSLASSSFYLLSLI